MILTDTSVVVDYVRGQDTRLVALVPTLPAAICGMVRAEVLCGARSPRHRALLEGVLNSFQQAPFPEHL